MNIALRMALAITAIILLGSCRSSRQLSYMQSISESQSGSLPLSDCSVRLAPQDELEIVVTSVVPTATAEYNLPSVNATYVSGGNASIMSNQTQQTYMVDSEGYIHFPVLGAIKVTGMTTSELKQSLTTRIAERVKDPHVKVKLLNFKVNVMGEVRSPRSVQITTERFSIFDALAAAGDMNEYGRRDNVLVIREVGDSITYTRLDLRDASVTASPCYYLRQNDVVIVEPNSVRESNARYNTNNSFKLSVISTVVSAVSVIASLLIALVVN